MRFDLGALSRREVYGLLTGSVVPRPIAFVSSIGDNGVPNVAPFSFFAAISAAPPRVVVSAGTRKGEKKDTVRNVEHSRDFVVNVVTEDIAEAMNAAAADLPPEISEFDEVGLTPVASEAVSSPRVAESPINLECRLVETVEIGEAPHATTLIVGEVLAIHVRDDLMSDGRIDVSRLRPIGRLNGDLYCRTRDIFAMPRPT